MKIFDVIVEADYEQGKALGKRLVSPSQWIKPEAGSKYEKGKDFGRKLVTPSEWFKSNKTDNDEPEAAPEKKTSTVSKEIQPNKLKDVVNSLLRDEPRYNEDIEMLKNFYSALESGKYNTSLDKSALMQTIKTAYTGGFFVA